MCFYFSLKMNNRRLRASSVIHRLDDRIIDPGHNRRGVEYERKIHFQPGYEELTKIVAGLQKDMKRVNQCLTLAGAQAYVAAVDKQGNPIRKNWQAHEDDITGPNGKPDGIKEVYVTDAKGNVKIVNGWTLGKTEYPIRKAYRTLYPTAQARKDNQYTDFLTDMYEIHNEFDPEGRPYYERDPAEIAPEFAKLQPEITPRMLFKDFLFKPVYENIKPFLKSQGIPPMLMAQIQV